MSKLMQLKAVFDELGKKQIKVGFFAHSHYTDGTPIAYIAAIQELGYPEGGIPPRPFLRPTMSDKKQDYSQLIFRATKASIKGRVTVSDGLAVIGKQMESDVKSAIEALREPKLKDETVAARRRSRSKGKATDKPLIFNGDLRDAVEFSVEEK
ncbi:hypothetical protein AB7W42_19210 [Providencia rettgeri]